MVLPRWPDLVAFGMLLIFCWLLARWTWHIASPDLIAEPFVGEGVSFDADAAAKTIMRAHLFGVPQVPAAAVQGVVSTPLNIKLKGVFSATGKAPAYAIVNSENQGDRPVKAGKEIKPGVVLEEIHPRYVVLSQNGVRERVELEEIILAGPARTIRPAIPARSAAAPSQSRAQALRPAPSDMAEFPPQVEGDFNLDVTSATKNQYSFSRSALNQALQDPKQLAKLGAVKINPAGGLTISDAPAGSLTQKLGLQAGDVVTLVNGQQVTTNDDLVRLYQQFALVNQITLRAMRNGTPLNLSYTVQQ